jgi:hypothetical protein
MDKRYKKILFFFLVILFIVSVPLTILYSQGYRFDFRARKIVQTGGFYFKITPSGARIFIENGPSKRTSFFSDGAFVGGLLPKTYQITVEREGYHSWKKILEVNERRVTEAKNITLFPLDLKFNFLFKEASAVFPHPKSKNLVIKSDAPADPNSQANNDLWQLKYFDFQKQEKTAIVEAQKLAGLLPEQTTASELSLVNIQWLPNTNKILIETIFRGEKKYFLTDFSSEKIATLALEFPKQFSNVLINPKNHEEIFFLAPATSTIMQQDTDLSSNKMDRDSEEEIIKIKALFMLKTGKEQKTIFLSSPLKEQEIITFTLTNDHIFWLTDVGLLYQGEITQNKIKLIEVLNKKPYPISPNLNYQIIAENPDRILLKENEAIYYLNSKTRIFEKIFEAIKEVKFSDDLRKVLARTDYQLWLFYLEDHSEQPGREAGEKVLLSAFDDYIDNIFWLNNHYIVFREKDKIKIIETDNRSNINIIELASFPNLQIFWNSAEKTLFAFSKDSLYHNADLLR